MLNKESYTKCTFSFHNLWMIVCRTVTNTAIIVPPEYRLSPTWKLKQDYNTVSGVSDTSPSHVSTSSDNSSYPEIIQVTPSASACLEDSDLKES